MLAVITVQLHKLREVHVQSERVCDGVLIEGESIRSQLDLIRHTLLQIKYEAARAGHRALANEVRSNQFGFRIHCDENPLIANLLSITAASNLALFLLDKGPDFVALDVAAAQVAHPGIQQSLAARSNHFQQSQDRVPVESSKSLRRTDRAALNETLNRPCRRLLAGAHRSKGRLRLGLAESRTAGFAAPALNAALTEVPKSLAGLVLASDAGHGFSPLAFEREKPDNHFGSGLWLTPRFGLAPQPVQAGSGALCVNGYGLSGWYNGNFHRGTLSSEANDNHDFHCVPPFSRRSVFSALGGSYLAPKSLAVNSGPTAWNVALPTVVVLPVIHFSFDLPALHQAFQDCMYGSEGIRVTAQIKLGLYKQITNAHRRIEIGKVCLHDATYSIGESRRSGEGLLQLLQFCSALGIGEKIGVSPDVIAHALNLFIEFVALGNQLVQPMPSKDDGCAIVFFIHRRGGYHV